MRKTTSSPNQERSNPERSCVACRQKRPQEELLRVVLDPESRVCVDYLGKLPGRGAYLCSTPTCIQKAAERGSFSKAFRRKVQSDAQSILQSAQQAAQRQICSLLALARRANVLAAGNHRVELSLRQGKALLLLLAHDASPGVQQRFQRWANREQIPTVITLSKSEFGPAVGLPACSLITIEESGFATKLAQEVQRLRQLLPSIDSPKENKDKETDT